MRGAHGNDEHEPYVFVLLTLLGFFPLSQSQSTMRLASPKQTQTTSPAQPTGKHYTIPGATASTVKTNIQHADYVNQSRIQEMINQRQISPTDRRRSDCVAQGQMEEIHADSQCGDYANISQFTGVSSTTKSTSSRPRSSTFSETPLSAQPTRAQFIPRYPNITQATAATPDYVNQSTIQEMIAKSQQSSALSSSPPDVSSLPAPIMIFTEDSTNTTPPAVPGSMPPSGASGVGSVVGGGCGGTREGEKRQHSNLGCRGFPSTTREAT